MAADPFECPKCGSRMRTDFAGQGYRCPSCDNREPFGHTLGSGIPGAPVTGAGLPASEGHAGPAGAGQGALDAGFRPPTLKSLASIIRVVYGEAEIAGLFGRSGFPEVWDYPGADWRFLYAALERTQRDFGPYGVAKVLETACSQQDRLGSGGVRERINECLRPCGVGIGDDCVARRLGQAGTPAYEVALFDQRRYHQLVIEHARPKFLKGEHFSAVVEGCKVLEELVRERSGIDDYGKNLMKRAFGDRGALEVDMADLTGRTRDGIRRGLGSMCEGTMSSVRNPASHEYEQRFPISGADALDMLSVISHLCRRVERMRRRPGSRPAQQGGDVGDPEPPGPGGQGTREPPRGNAGSPDTSMSPWFAATSCPYPPRDSAESLSSLLRAARPRIVPKVEELVVKPGTVEVGETVNVTVTGTIIGEWHVGVYSEDGKVKSSPTPLEAYDPPTSAEGGAERYAFSFSTVNYDPGEYRVSASFAKDMDAAGLCIKKFMVVGRQAARADGGKTAGTL